MEDRLLSVQHVPLHVAIDPKVQQGGLQHYLVLVEKGNAKSLRSFVSSMYVLPAAHRRIMTKSYETRRRDIEESIYELHTVSTFSARASLSTSFIFHYRKE